MDKKTIKEFANLKSKLNLREEREVLKNEVVYLSRDAVVSFGTKEKELVDILGEPDGEVPDLDKLDGKEGAKSVKVGVEYFKSVFKLLSKCPEAELVKLTVRDDYPLKIEIENLNSRFFIAPRVKC